MLGFLALRFFLKVSTASLITACSEEMALSTACCRSFLYSSTKSSSSESQRFTVRGCILTLAAAASIVGFTSSAASTFCCLALSVLVAVCVMACQSPPLRLLSDHITPKDNRPVFSFCRNTPNTLNTQNLEKHA